MFEFIYVFEYLRFFLQERAQVSYLTALKHLLRPSQTQNRTENISFETNSILFIKSLYLFGKSSIFIKNNLSRNNFSELLEILAKFGVTYCPRKIPYIEFLDSFGNRRCHNKLKKWKKDLILFWKMETFSFNFFLFLWVKWEWINERLE